MSPFAILGDSGLNELVIREFSFDGNKAEYLMDEILYNPMIPDPFKPYFYAFK